MSSDALAYRPTLTRKETGTLLAQTMGLVGLTAGCFALGAYLGRDMSYQLGWVWFIAAFGCLIAMSFAAARSEWAAVGLLFCFGALIGLAVAPTLAYYAGADPRAVWLSGIATGLFVTGAGIAGYLIHRDLSALSRALFWALLALIAFGIVLAFVEIPNGALIYALAGLVIFAGITLIDFQRVRESKDIPTAPLLAASIFLDILNVFLLFLSIFGESNS